MYRIQAIEVAHSFDVREINIPMWTESTQNAVGLRRLTRNLFRNLRAHASACVRYLRAPRPSIAYVPYPAIFILFFLSCLPSRCRPKFLVADVFISIYDTVVNDRAILKSSGGLARLLRWMEARAYQCADLLVVDTKQSSKYIAALFDLPMSKVVSMPLSTNEIEYYPVPYYFKPGLCRVLFVGTLVPLHGTATILEAIRMLAGRKEIEFRIIGGGQDADLIRNWMKECDIKIQWEESWQTPAQLAAAIAQADICLGIFGMSAKTQRVCPFKIYSYAAIGRPIITGRTEWLVDAALDIGYEPFSSVPVGDAAALAREIGRLADDPELRQHLAVAAHRFYLQTLSNKIAESRLIRCLMQN